MASENNVIFKEEKNVKAPNMLILWIYFSRIAITSEKHQNDEIRMN